MKVHFKLLYLILPEGFRKEQGVPSEHPLPAASKQDPRAVFPHHRHASPEQRPLHTCGPTAPNAHLEAPISHSLAAPPVPDPRAHIDGAQIASADPEAAPPPPNGDSEAPGREGCKHMGRPQLHDRLGATARCPHPAAGGSDPGAEDRERLVLLWAGGVGGRWPLGRRGRAVRGWG